MAMGSARKFLFDVSFDEAEPPHGRAAAELPPDPAFVRADVDAARTEGYAEGREAALGEAAVSSECRIAAALEKIGNAIPEIVATQKASVAETEKAALALVRAVLQKAVPALCRKDPLSEFEALIVQSLSENLDEPRFVLRVGDAMFDAIEARIAPMTRATGYGGKLVLLTDPDIADGDVRIEWADGGAERDTRRLMHELDIILDRALAHPTASDGP
jgi:flagellar assembly protein FliH